MADSLFCRAGKKRCNVRKRTGKEKNRMPQIILFLIGILMFVFAWLLYFKEAYWLLSGVNFSSRKKAEQDYDLKGLTKHFGKMCAWLGAVLFLSGICAGLKQDMPIFMLLGSMFIIIPVFLFGSERYMITGQKGQRTINIVVTLFLAGVLVFVIVIMVNGSKAPVIDIRDGELVIDCSYGTEISIDSIESIGMIDLKDRNLSKRNGFNMGDTLRGYFLVEGVGPAMLYQQGKPGNTIDIKTYEKELLINLGSESANQELMNEIEDEMKE